MLPGDLAGQPVVVVLLIQDGLTGELLVGLPVRALGLGGAEVKDLPLEATRTQILDVLLNRSVGSVVGSPVRLGLELLFLSLDLLALRGEKEFLADVKPAIHQVRDEIDESDRFLRIKFLWLWIK